MKNEFIYYVEAVDIDGKTASNKTYIEFNTVQ